MSSMLMKVLYSPVFDGMLITLALSLTLYGIASGVSIPQVVGVMVGLGCIGYAHYQYHKPEEEEIPILGGNREVVD